MGLLVSRCLLVARGGRVILDSDLSVVVDSMVIVPVRFPSQRIHDRAVPDSRLWTVGAHLYRL